MPASGSQRSISARAACGWRRLPGAVLTSTSTATPAPRSSSVIRSAVAVPCPKVSSISPRSYAGPRLASAHAGGQAWLPCSSCTGDFLSPRRPAPSGAIARAPSPVSWLRSPRLSPKAVRAQHRLRGLDGDFGDAADVTAVLDGRGDQLAQAAQQHDHELAWWRGDAGGTQLRGVGEVLDE